MAGPRKRIAGSAGADVLKTTARKGMRRRWGRAPIPLVSRRPKQPRHAADDFVAFSFGLLLGALSPSRILLSPRACKHPAAYATCTTLHKAQKHPKKTLLRACGRGGQRPRASTPNRNWEQQTLGHAKSTPLEPEGGAGGELVCWSRVPDTQAPRAICKKDHGRHSSGAQPGWASHQLQIQRQQSTRIESCP